MKFGDKYELLESLTTGGVETFVANDRVRGERVLVHILHCDPQRANQPTVQWVLETFRRVAPEPAGLVLETGRYSGTLYAYLVTKLPDDAALQGWVRQYKAQARDTQEIPAPFPKPTPESQAPTADALPTEPSRAAGPIAQLFREFDLQAKSGPPSPPPKAIEQPSRPLPNISLSADQSGVRPVPPWDLETPRVSVPPKPVPNVSTPADSYRPDFTAKTFRPAPSTPPIKDGPKPGEFTSFFQGPFRGDRPLETPAVSSQPMEPPRKTVGDFTATFGPLKPPPAESLPSSGIAGNEPAGTGFTGFFSPDVPSRTSSTTAPPSTGLPRASVDPAPVFPAPPKEPVVAPQPASYVAPAPPIFPTPVPLNPPMPKSPPAASSAPPSDNATRAFSRPTEPTPGPPPPPSGPSAYTQIISVKPMNPAEDAAGAPKQAPPKSPALPVFPMPPMPAMAPPPLPPPFHMPPPPPMPKLAVPPPPPAPKLAKVDVPEPPVSPWPLILTLTVLFVIAALLVLYFVLKH